ncbi:MAG: type III-A CRISPR-associated protein Csm2 [Desulfobacteraceae bacterium 4572_88]|nr:MAG: type III-A CRISPR-associated protein Csm2 [Desulfobacteraceae bacterium 4572_88]RLC17222.1 MAG: type III-A CRISPR-associated protein Csm2 [Deltaproteobacteria bacterium]
MPDKNTIKRIIDGDSKTLVAEAERLGNQLKENGLTTSQIRNVFGSVKKMEMKGFNADELRLLKPKLAYAASRPGAKPGTKTLRSVLSDAIDCVGDGEDNFLNFCNFFEAILAYHRAAGGK